MNASILLAASAVGHPDGTFSLLRGGINRVQSPQGVQPTLKGTLLAQLAADGSESGSHEFAIRCLDSSGKAAMPDFTGKIQTAPQGGMVNIIVDIQIAFPTCDRYSFVLEVDKRRLAVWPIEVIQPKEGA